MNHSSDPNILYHCGIGFSRRHIAAGDELTCDYRLYLPGGERVVTAAGESVVGLPPLEALRTSARLLLELLDDADRIDTP